MLVVADRVKVAVTDFAAVIDTIQVSVPVQAPLQPVNDEPTEGAAARVTLVLIAYASEQSTPQLIPGGVLETVPMPVPTLLTVRMKVFRLKVAVTFLDADMVTLQVPVPLQAPLQPAKVEFHFGLAVKVTTVLAGKSSAQSVPQEIPAGELVTVPLPVPSRLTVRVSEEALARLTMLTPHISMS